MISYDNDCQNCARAEKFADRLENRLDKLNSELSDAQGEIGRLESEIANRADRWIPVSERLPEKGGLYLVTVVKEEWNTFVDKCFLGRKLTVEGEFMWFCARHSEVTAWQPLPEPYEEEK